MVVESLGSPQLGNTLLPFNWNRVATLQLRKQCHATRNKVTGAGARRALYWPGIGRTPYSSQISIFAIIRHRLLSGVQPSMTHETMELSWKDSIYRQREELARMLREPLAQLVRKCVPVWGDRDRLNAVLLDGFSTIPYCTYLYVVDTNRVQVSDNVSKDELMPEHYHRNRAERPYIKQAIPSWGFLLS